MDGERNDKNQTLEEFLTCYDNSKFPKPSVTADVLVISSGRILLIKRKNHPELGKWALPGGFLNMDETAEACALRELKEETGITAPLRQAFTVSSLDRDPRGRTITVCYTNLPHTFDLVKILNQADNLHLRTKAGDDAAEAKWFGVEISANGNEYAMALTSGEIKLYSKLQLARDHFGKIDFNQTQIVQNNGIAFDHSKIIFKILSNN